MPEGGKMPAGGVENAVCRAKSVGPGSKIL
jgi:hypothetical protein